MDLQISRIGQVSMRVHDVHRATHFYRDVLGLQFLFSAPGGLSFFQCGEVRVMLSKAESPEFDHPASVLYYHVADIHAAHGTLSGRGVRFEGAPHRIANLGDHELWMCFLRDSEDNMLALMSEIPKP